MGRYRSAGVNRLSNLSSSMLSICHLYCSIKLGKKAIERNSVHFEFNKPHSFCSSVQAPSHMKVSWVGGRGIHLGCGH